MDQPVPSPTYRPIGEEPSGASALLRHLVPLALLAVLGASFLAPDLVRRILPPPLGQPNVAPLIAFAALVLFGILSGTADLRRRQGARRAAFSAFAASMGGQVTQQPLRRDASGWEAEEHVEYTVQGRGVVLSAIRGKETAFAFRLVSEVPLRRDFQMQILPGGRAMRFVLSQSFLLPVFSVAIRTQASARVRTIGATRTAADPPAAALDPAQLLERMRYLADDPVTTGDAEFDKAFLVKATDRDAARNAASDPGLHAALAALAARTKNFQAGVERESPDAAARVVVNATADSAAELFTTMEGVRRALDEALARAGVREGSARGVA